MNSTDLVTDFTPWKCSRNTVYLKFYIGFVYQILEKDTGKSYIGYKKFWKKVTKQPLKGRKNKRHSKVESDWRTYNSSSNKSGKLLQKKIKDNPENYTKTILRLCKSATELKVWEAKYQIDYYTTGRWNELFNEYIGFRLRIRHGGD